MEAAFREAIKSRSCLAHTYSRSKTLSKNSASAETQLAEEELIILHRFGGAAIYGKGSQKHH